jgi:hypothetical protein
LSQLCTVNATLEKGTYVLSAKVFWNEEEHECCLTAYGPDRVAFEKTDRAIAPRFKEEVIGSFARTMRSSAAVSSFESYGYRNVLQEVLMSLPCGMGYIKTVNKSAREFHCKGVLSLKGMKVIKPKQPSYEFHLPAGREDVMGFFLSATGFSYSKSQTFWQ